MTLGGDLFVIAVHPNCTVQYITISLKKYSTLPIFPIWINTLHNYSTRQQAIFGGVANWVARLWLV